MSQTIKLKDIMAVAAVLFAIVAVVDGLILVAAVLENDSDAMSRWVIRHIEDMVWLSVAETLGLTGVIGRFAATALKSWATLE